MRATAAGRARKHFIVGAPALPQSQLRHVVLSETGGGGHALAADAVDEVDARVGRVLENLGRPALGIKAVLGALDAPVGQVEDAAGFGQHQRVEVAGVVEIQGFVSSCVGVFGGVADDDGAVEGLLEQQVDALLAQLGVHVGRPQLGIRRAAVKRVVAPDAEAREHGARQRHLGQRVGGQHLELSPLQIALRKVVRE